MSGVWTSAAQETHRCAIWLRDLVSALVAADRGAGYVPRASYVPRAARPEPQLLFAGFTGFTGGPARPPRPLREPTCMPAVVPW
ncbi:hypothetical protein [Streptomyces olivaceoviridis]|uniref:hypothetical protein n=1 Tax=Streptomyces olivaceoviridis TaxID=1921 RepID=UPI0036BB6A9C